MIILPHRIFPNLYDYYPKQVIYHHLRQEHRLQSLRHTVFLLGLTLLCKIESFRIIMREGVFSLTIYIVFHRKLPFLTCRFLRSSCLPFLRTRWISSNRASCHTETRHMYPARRANLTINIKYLTLKSTNLIDCHSNYMLKVINLMFIVKL